MRLTWYGHSCFLLESGSHRILMDPFLEGNRNAPLAPADVRCNTITCSHAHDDHVHDLSVIARRNAATVIAPYELAVHFSNEGIDVLDPMPGGSVAVPFGRVKLTPASHSSAFELEGGKNLSMGSPCGFVFEIDGRRIYHAGDTALFSDMVLIGQPGLDVALLPIGDRYTMGIDDAVKALDYLLPRYAVPMHYNTNDAITVDAEEFRVKACAAGHRSVILQPGVPWNVP